MTNPRVLSTEEVEERFKMQKAAIQEYRACRQEVLRGRENERRERNETKQHQLEWAQELQVRLLLLCLRSTSSLPDMLTLQHAVSTYL